jgi:hypothetical protein
MRLDHTLRLNDYKPARELHARQKVGGCLNYWMFLRLITAMGGPSRMFSSIAPAEGNTKLIETLFPFDASLLWLAALPLLPKLIDLQPYVEQRFALNRTAQDRRIEAEVECIVFRVPGISKGEIFWRCAFRFAQEENIAGTYLPDTRSPCSPTTLLFCPPRVELNDHLSRRVRKAWQC